MPIITTRLVTVGEVFARRDKKKIVELTREPLLQTMERVHVPLAPARLDLDLVACCTLRVPYRVYEQYILLVFPTYFYTVYKCRSVSPTARHRVDLSLKPYGSRLAYS